MACDMFCLLLQLLLLPVNAVVTMTVVANTVVAIDVVANAVVAIDVVANAVVANATLSLPHPCTLCLELPGDTQHL
jgi:hypothetical protein